MIIKLNLKKILSNFFTPLSHRCKIYRFLVSELRIIIIFMDGFGK